MHMGFVFVDGITFNLDSVIPYMTCHSSFIKPNAVLALFYGFGCVVWGYAYEQLWNEFIHGIKKPRAA